MAARAQPRHRGRVALQGLVQEEGKNFALAPWDWRYYSEKLRKLRCDIDETAIKPYFQLDRIIEAAFYTANRLFGLTFERREGIPVLQNTRQKMLKKPNAEIL